MRTHEPDKNWITLKVSLLLCGKITRWPVPSTFLSQTHFINASGRIRIRSRGLNPPFSVNSSNGPLLKLMKQYNRQTQYPCLIGSRLNC